MHLELSPRGALMALMADDPDLITVLLLPAAIAAGAVFGVIYVTRKWNCWCAAGGVPPRVKAALWC
jgi:hypothetical protein